MTRVGATKLGLWQRIKRLALTDVAALARGLKADDLEQVERILLEADFGVPATLDLVALLESEVRKGRIKSDDDLRSTLVDQLAIQRILRGQVLLQSKSDSAFQLRSLPSR